MPSKRYKDESHLKWIRTLPCLLCKAGFYSHSREVQAHHLLKPNEGYKGTSNRLGVKSNDSDAIPLCLHHHAQLHTKFGDEYKFFASYGLPENFGQVWAKRLWEEKLWKDDSQEDNDLPF